MAVAMKWNNEDSWMPPDCISSPAARALAEISLSEGLAISGSCRSTDGHLHGVLSQLRPLSARFQI